MADISLQSIGQQLRRLTAASSAGALTDAQLLRRVVELRDEAAFEVLVWRNGPLVLGVCRKLLGQEQDAEDAFQATFLVLARKAASIGKGGSLAAWPHQVACRIARRLRVQEQRRKSREQREIDLDHVPGAAKDSTELEQREAWRVAAQELQRLPACYREPIMCCYLQGKTHAEAARELNRPQGSMSSLLVRGCELLRFRLTRRGISLSFGAIATLLAEQASAGLTPALVQPTVTRALEFSSGVAILGTPAVLAREVIQNTIMSQILRESVAPTRFCSSAQRSRGSWPEWQKGWSPSGAINPRRAAVLSATVFTEINVRSIVGRRLLRKGPSGSRRSLPCPPRGFRSAAICAIGSRRQLPTPTLLRKSPTSAMKPHSQPWWTALHGCTGRGRWRGRRCRLRSPGLGWHGRCGGATRMELGGGGCYG